MKNHIPQTAAVPDCDYIIIGGTGDLAMGKIFPALLWRFLEGQVTHEFRLIAVSRADVSLQTFATRLKFHCKAILKETKTTEKQWQCFIELVRIVRVDMQTGENITQLQKLINRRLCPTRPLIFYLAVASDLFGTTCSNLKKIGLALPQVRIVVEKPLGDDYASAKDINNQLLKVFNEKQIYRIDHYLGKETVQNLMALRFANSIFESQWDNRHIDHVQISVAETVGVENRSAYYETCGAIRDMLQNHLLQLICLIAMDPPAYFDADQVRDEKLRVLRALRSVQPNDVTRGQYQEYESEVGYQSNTETYVAMRIFIDNRRWAGVPFYVRTGKKMKIRASEIIITFKTDPHDIFSNKEIQSSHSNQPNRLVIRVQPQEGLRLQFTSKEPGPGGMRLSPSELNLSFNNAFTQRLPEAYERLLMDVARGNQTLFMRLDEVLAAWRFIDPIVEHSALEPPTLYRADTMGPDDTILKSSNHKWYTPQM